jgi:plasmid stabilization system protein ParE
LRALADLARVQGFLASVDRGAARTARERLEAAAERLLAFPRLGQRVEQHRDVEVRRLIVGDCELRYAVEPRRIVIAHVWHGRENR